MAWVRLLVAGLLEVVWAYSMKLSEGFTRLVPSVVTIAAMIASFGLLSLAMRSIPLGSAYTIWTSIGAVGAFIMGIVFLGEQLSAIFLFAMMAEVLSAAGIAQAFAQTMFGALSIGAVFLTPVISGFFGILTNSGNAPNSLFMPSQLSLAVQAGLSIPAVAALQHVSGTSLGFFSPVRMSIAAGLANGARQERTVYRYLMWPALSAFAILLATAGWLVL